MHANRAGKPSKITLHEMKTGGAARAGFGPLLFAHNQHHAGLDENANAVRRDARQIEDHLDALLRFEHIEQRHALAGDDMPAARPTPRQILEEASHLRPEVADIGRD